MIKTLGLDISCSTCGFAIIENKIIIDAGFFDISDVTTYKEKSNIIIDGLKGKQFDSINVEESLCSFTFGKTSQNTILKLAINKAVICYILEEYYGIKINSINVNTARKYLFNKCRIKGVKSKIFVKQQVESMFPYINKFIITTKRGNFDKRNEDMYDAVVIGCYNQ